jgi:hypothetical protein
VDRRDREGEEAAVDREGEGEDAAAVDADAGNKAFELSSPRGRARGFQGRSPLARLRSCERQRIG